VDEILCYFYGVALVNAFFWRYVLSISLQCCLGFSWALRCGLPTVPLMTFNDTGHSAYHGGVIKTHCLCGSGKSGDIPAVQFDMVQTEEHVRYSLCGYSHDGNGGLYCLIRASLGTVHDSCATMKFLWPCLISDDGSQTPLLSMQSCGTQVMHGERWEEMQLPLWCGQRRCRGKTAVGSLWVELKQELVGSSLPVAVNDWEWDTGKVPSALFGCGCLGFFSCIKMSGSGNS
jgi:hypothetical protein